MWFHAVVNFCLGHMSSEKQFFTMVESIYDKNIYFVVFLVGSLGRQPYTTRYVRRPNIHCYTVIHRLLVVGW